MKKTILILLLIFSILQSNAQYYYHEQFFDENFPSNLTQEHIVGNLDFFVDRNLGGPNHGHSRPYQFTLRGDNDNNGAITRLILPTVDISTASHPQLVFWHVQHPYYSNVDELKLYYRTSSSNDWILLKEWTEVIGPWKQEIINLPEQSSTYEISFVGKCNSGHGVVIDDIAIQDGPVCPPPSDLTATNIIGTQAELSWFSFDDLSTWEIEYGPTNFTQGNGNFVTAHSNTYTLTGLSPLTTYDYYVRTNCGLTSSPSSWIGPYTFRTGCDTIDSFPYQYGFEDITPTYETDWNESCWATSPIETAWKVSESDTPSNTTGPDAAHSGSNFAYSENFFRHEPLLLSPMFDMSALNHPQLHFYYHMFGIYIKALYVDTYDGTNWTTNVWSVLGQQQLNSSDSWHLASVTIPNNTIQIRFRAERYKRGAANIAIDDISIEDSTCPVPSNLSVTNTTNSETTLNWTENGAANSWDIEYGTHGFTHGNGTIITANTKPFTLTGLTPNTKYSYYIRSNCGGNNSYWIGPFDFRTFCNPITTFPYNYGFEDITPNYEGDWTGSCWYGNPENIPLDADNGPARWTITNTTTPSHYTGPDNAHSGSNFAYSESGNSNNAGETIIFSPMFNMSGLVQPKLSFYYHMYGIYDDTLQVDIFNGTNWTNGVWSISGEQQTHSYDPWRLAEISIPNNTVQIRFRAIYNGNKDIAIDDIVIKDSTCFAPTDISVSDITANTAKLDWTENGTAISWQIEYGPFGFTPGQGTRLTTATKPYTLTGLSPNTEYQVYIKSDCNGDNSYWTNPIHFLTYCNTINTFPYTYGFEDVTANDIADWTESCWKGEPHNIDTNSTDYHVMFRWNVTDSSIPNTNSDPDAAHSGTHFAYTKSYVSEGSVTELYSPIFDMSSLTYPQLSFWHCVPNSLVGSLYVDVYDGNDWTEIRTVERYHNGNSPPWSLEKILIPNNTIQIRIRAVKGGERYGNISIDDIRIEGISCPKPTDLTSTNPTTNSITLDWTENGTATSWQIEYGPKGFTQGQGTSITTSTKPYVLTGLNPHTQYEYYVKADCGGGNESDWSESIDFSTSPENDYCANAIPLNVQTSICINNYSTYSNIGASNSGIPTPTCGTNAQPDVWFKITVPDSRNLTIKATIGSSYPRIGLLNLSVYSGDCNNLNEIDCVEATTWSSTNYIKIDDLTAGETLYIRIYQKDGQQGYFNICASTNTCPLPENLSAVNLSPTETEISWTEMGNATAWNVEYGPKGFSHGQGTSINVNSTTYTLTGLTSGEGYDFYVQPDCISNDWEGPYTFYAGCPTINSFPYEYGFEDSTSSYNNPTISWGGTCWFEESDSNSFHWLPGLDNVTPSYSYNSAHSGTKFAYVYNSFSSTGDITNLISPEFDMSALTNPELSFYYHMFGYDIGSLSVDIYDGTQWINDIWAVSGSQLTRDTDPYKLIHLPIPNNTTKIRFKTERGEMFYSSKTICIDDIKIEDVTCSVPTNLSVSNITNNQADLSWTENGTATAWDIEYGISGFTQGQGTTINVNNTTHNFTNLTPNAYYDVYVRANCGSGNTSHWVGPYTFHTLCDIVNTFPYQYGFEDVTPNTDDSWRESCWSAFPDYTLGINNPRILWTVKEGMQNNYFLPSAHEGNNYAIPDKSYLATGFSTDLFSPVFDMSNLASPQLSFYYFMYANSVGTLYVDIFDGTSWINNIWSRSGSQQESSDDPWKYARIQIPNNTTQIRFRAEADLYQNNNNIIIDDISIQDTPNCLTPSDLFASNIADTHVRLNWTTAGQATNWNIEYGPTGFTQGQGATINVNTNHYTLTGLTQLTSYDVYVQSACSNNYESDWIGPLTFTTLNEDYACGNVIQLQVNSNCIFNTFSNTNATDSGIPRPTCIPSNGYNGGDVWFKVTVPNTRNIRIETNEGDITDGVLAVYSGDCNNLTEIACNDDVYASMMPEIFLYNLIAGEELFIRFFEYGGDTFGTFDICVTTLPCIQPTDLSANVTATTAELSWVENGGATSWNIEYGPSGFTQGQGTTISINSNPYILTGLTVNTSYDYYVQSDCGGGNFTSWVGPYTFTTGYNITPTSPYNYSFENLTPNTNGDWTGSDWTSIPANSGPRFTSQYSWTPNSGSTPTSNTGPSSAHTGSIYAYAEASNFNPNDIAQLISPIFDLTNLTQPELIFYYHMYGADMGKLYVDTYDGTTWTNDVWSIQGQQQISETDLWLPATVTISNTVKQIRFRAERGLGIHGDIAVDDVTIQESTSSINQYSNIFNIYPNPSMGDFTIVSEQNLKAKIYIYSMSGKEIYQSYIRNKITKISLKGMEKGVYTIKILSDDKQYISKLILK